MKLILQKLVFLFLLTVYVDGGFQREPLPAKRGDLEVPDFPYVVAIKLADKFICNGAIISPNKILTTANCMEISLKNSSCDTDCEKLIRIETGISKLSQSGDVYKMQSFKNHEQFVIKNRLRAHNIAIITLSSNIQFKSNVKAIELPNKDIVDGSIATAQGWKQINQDDIHSPKILQNSNFTIFSNDDCHKEDDSLVVDYNDFCGTPKRDEPGSCDGNLGNPLVQDGKLIGLISYGFGLCDLGISEIYVNVFKHLDFIKRELA